MDEVLKLEIFYIELFHIIAIIISVLCFCIMYAKAKRGPLLNAFFYVHSLMLTWLITKVLKTVSPNVELRWFFVVLQYVAVSCLQPAFFEFGYIYLTGKTLKKWIRSLLYIIPVLQMIVIITNPYHHLFYLYFNFRKNAFGPAFNIHMMFEYTYFAFGIIFCAIKLRKLFMNRPLLGLVLGLAILFPFTINLMYITFNLKKVLVLLGIKFAFDATPIAFTFSLILLIYVTFKKSFLDVSPLMQHEILRKINIPILIINKNMTLSDYNDKAEQIELHLIDQSVLHELKNNIEEIPRITCNNQVYIVIKKIIYDLKREKYVLIFNDITKYIEIKNSLDEKNIEIENKNTLLEEKITMLQETSEVAARNYIARELHDVIGHSLVLTLRLCELSKMNYNQDKQAAAEKMQEAMLTIEKSFEELKKVVRIQENKIYTSTQLKSELDEMIKQVNLTEIEVKSYLRGTIRSISEEQYNAIISVVKESMTNMLKYSKASRVIISVKLNEEEIEVFIIDNGIGCVELKKGNGIRGIEERVKKIGGHIDFSYGKETGFQVQMLMPARL